MTICNMDGPHCPMQWQGRQTIDGKHDKAEHMRWLEDTIPTMLAGFRSCMLAKLSMHAKLCCMHYTHMHTEVSGVSPLAYPRKTLGHLTL